MLLVLWNGSSWNTVLLSLIFFIQDAPSPFKKRICTSSRLYSDAIIASRIFWKSEALLNPAVTTFPSSLYLPDPSSAHPSYAMAAFISAFGKCLLLRSFPWRFSHTPSASSNNTGISLTPFICSFLSASINSFSSFSSFSPSVWITFHTPAWLIGSPVVSLTFSAQFRYDISVIDDNSSLT